MSKKWIRYIIVFIVLLVLLCIITPFLVIGFESKIQKHYLNNTYVNDNFPNWKYVRIDNWNDILFPDCWSINSDGGVIQITNKDGSEIAVGTVFRSISTSFENKKTFLEKAFGIKISDIIYEYSKDGFSATPSTFHKFCVSTEDRIIECYFLTLVDTNDSSELFFTFPIIGNMKDEEITEICRAILFAFRWDVEK